MKCTKTILRSVFGASICIGTVLAPTRADEPREVDSTTPGDLLVRAQGICPVSGKDLTKVEQPVKAEVDGRTVFLCCRECLGRDVSATNLKRIHENLRAAQGRCPVWDKPLPVNAASVVVGKRLVYLCRPPCGPQIQKEPDRYLAVVARLLARNLGQSRGR